MTNLISKIFGLIAGYNFPPKLQNFINKKYVEYFKIDLSEFPPINEYENLNELFTRRLIDNRKFSLDECDFLAPSDGEIFEIGAVKDFEAFSIKGCKYDVSELLDELKPQSSENLSYLNIYLSPKDYHNYHAPCDMQILNALYIPAKLYSVAKKYLVKIPNLYAKNERVILKCKAKNGGIFWLVFVGALNVGKMKFTFDEKIKTNAKNGKFCYKYENLYVKKGERIGNFELGSTIVIISDSEKLTFLANSAQNIKFAQTIGKLKF